LRVFQREKNEDESKKETRALIRFPPESQPGYIPEVLLQGKERLKEVICEMRMETSMSS